MHGMASTRPNWTIPVRYASFEARLAQDMTAHGIRSPSNRDDAIRRSDLADIWPAVLQALMRAGIDPQRFVKTLGDSGLAAFVDDLPTRWVTNLLRRGKHRQGQQKWIGTDFADVVALPVPAVHCDVLVTEKQWIHHLRLGGVEQRFGTRLLSDTSDLVDVLVSVSRL